MVSRRLIMMSASAFSVAGSLNSPGRMRFDFTSPEPVSTSVLTEVEEEVNDYLRTDVEVQTFVTNKAKALELGAVALFGESAPACRNVTADSRALAMCHKPAREEKNTDATQPTRINLEPT